MKTVPSKRYINHEWHWLWSELAWSPVVSQWLNGDWYSTGEAERITPEEMYKRGWRWLTPAIPPKLERNRDIPDEDLDYIPT